MLTYQGNNFYLDDKKINIYAGAIHYFRTVPEYWEDRLTKLKLAGFNTVETYVCWNLHEKKQGEFDFSGILDIVRFLETAQKLGLYAIVRPGPYICAEWDFGGLPAWLLKDRNMRVRCMYKPYLDAVTAFYKALITRLLPMMHSNGGNIIAMQIENEYGSYGNDKEYLSFVENLMLDCGVTELLFTSDGPEDDMLSGGTLPHVLKVANFGSRVSASFKKLKEYQGFEAPSMCGEFWNGWFDHFGERHHSRPVASVETELKAMLNADANFSFYMFHGGTNFGFNAGANYDVFYNPTVTSYDDDALLNEWGGYTPKYHAVRKILLAHQGLAEEALPPEPARQSIGTVKLNAFSPLITNIGLLGDRHESVCPESMEYYGQNFGFICYHNKLKGKYHGKLTIDGLADRAYVFVNQKFKGVIYRNDKNQSISLGSLSGENDIDIVVEAMGRVNYGPQLMDRKGAEQIRINNQLLSHWEVFTMPLENTDKLKFSSQKCPAPLFMHGEFKTNSKADCFVHTNGFKKGYIFVNGFNLGRYWEIGPQESLYIPGTILKENNEIVVLELEGNKTDSIVIDDTHNIAKKKKIFGIF